MKSRAARLLYVAAGLWLIAGSDTHADPIGTAITYQGQLKEAGVPANGDYDFVFRLFDSPTAPSQVGDDRSANDWPVSNGLFTVPIDFGADVFTGDAFWLEVAVRQGDSNGDYTTLTPRQPVTAAPYALYALDGMGGVVEHWTANGSDINNTNSGNVGIGTPTPQMRLHVVESDSRADVKIESTNGGDADYARIWMKTAEHEWGIENDGSGDVFKIRDHTAGVDRLTINHEGEVGIGTTTPNADLDVGGTVRIYGDAVGSMTMRGANGTFNTVIGAPGFTPNTGAFWAYDQDGAVRAQMYVSLNNQGYVLADVKSFCVPDPHNPAEDIWYACIEGPEAAMYIRGTGQLIDGRATIELPDHFRVLAAEDGMTVQLTPRSAKSMGLATGARGLESIEVVELHGGRGNYEFDWEVKAVRLAHQDFKVRRSWKHVLPGGGPGEEECWAARLKSIERRERRIQEMEARLAADHEKTVR